MIVVRVYGILINEQNEILVTDETFNETKITKFCGGGLEQGEGTIDCLKREFIEEMNLKIEVLEHFYTTDFYQQSAFNKAHQIISIYYKVKNIDPIKITQKNVDFNDNYLNQTEKEKHTQVFRFIPLLNFSENSVTLPIDKVVARLILKKF